LPARISAQAIEHGTRSERIKVQLPLAEDPPQNTTPLHFVQPGTGSVDAIADVIREITRDFVMCQPMRSGKPGSPRPVAAVVPAASISG
jgi:hypothetical protein